MMRRVHLYGALRKEFGKGFTLDVDSVAEVARALEANFPGRFFKALRDGAFKLVRGDRRSGLVLNEQELTFRLGSGDLHIIPVPKGAAASQRSKGGAKAVIGVAIMAVAIIAAPASAGTSLGGLVVTQTGALTAYGTAAMFGLSMALSGVSMMLSPQAKMGDLEQVENRKSFLFNGPVNSIEQGGPVPLIYGRLRVGSTVVSAGMAPEQIMSGGPTGGNGSEMTTVVLAGSLWIVTTTYPDISHFHVGTVRGGTLHLADHTPVEADSLLTVAQVAGGLRFIPDDDEFTRGVFAIQAARRVGNDYNFVGALVETEAGGYTDPWGRSGFNGPVADGGISGSGGGKGGGGGSGGAREDADSLQSRSTARVVDLIGEGELEELPVGKSKGVYFDGTPLENADGTLNFKGVSWQSRVGLPSQDHIAGFAAAENEIAVSTRVRADTPVIRTITDTDALRVTLRFPMMTQQDADDGDLHGSKVQIAIDVRPYGGGWRETITDTIEGKATAAYERAYRIELPEGGAPWDVRVRRLTPDSTSATVQNESWWSSYTQIVDGKYSYPDSALIALTVDSEQFGSSIPARAYDVKGLRVSVPDIYDPENHSYANGGIWQGGFKTAWTDNPAWVLYDLITNTRYGLGRVIDASQIDKWSLYQIAQYCDQPVPNGAGGWEPRFTFNGIIQTREDAYKVIQSICSAFRGMAYWAAGQVFASADMPGDDSVIVAPANVLDGVFSYAGTALKARHTVAKVAWNDPADEYRGAIEVIENTRLIERHGHREIEVSAFGCTSRSQARRLGLWILDSEQHETETVTYRCSFDHLEVTPGQIIQVADPAYALVRLGGRVAAATVGRVTLDAPVTLEAGHAYTLSVTLPDGRVLDRAVAGGIGGHSALTLVDPLPVAPDAGAMWSLSSASLTPRRFRVRSIRELEPNVFEVTALLHDPTKYARVEQGLNLPAPAYQGGVTPLPAPANLRAVESVYWVNGLPQARVSVSWTTSNLPEIAGYRADVMTPGGQWQEWATTRVGGFDIEPAAEGRYTIRVTTLGHDNRRASAEIGLIVRGKGTPPGQPTGLAASGGIRQIALRWSNPTDTDLAHIEVWESETNDLTTAEKIAEVKGSNFIRAGLPGLAVRYYWVRAVDLGGNIGDFNSNLGTAGEARPAGVEDMAQAVWDRVKDDIVHNVPDIDFSFLDTHVERLIQRQDFAFLDARVEAVMARSGFDNALAETLAESVRLGYERFEALQQTRGDSRRRFAAVDQRITQEVSDRQALAETVTEMGAAWENNRAIITDRLTAQADDLGALAEEVTLLAVKTGEDIAAAVLTESRARTDGDTALAESIHDLTATVGDNRALAEERWRTLADADSAEAANRTVLEGKVDGNWTRFVAEQTARADAEQALAEDIRTLRSDVDGNVAAIGRDLQTLAQADEVQAKDITTLFGRVGDTAAALADETTLRVKEDSALAQRVTQQKAQLDADLASLNTEMRTWVDESSAVANELRTLTSEFDGNKAAVAGEIKAVSDSLSATATDVQALATRVGDAEAGIASESRARADLDKALTETITQQRSQIDNNIAGLETSLKTWVTAESTVARSVSTLQTTVNDNTTKISTQQSSIDGLRGRYSITVDANGYVSGMDLLSNTNNGVSRSSLIFRVDDFMVVKPGQTGATAPFVITTVGGVQKVGISSALIGDAVIKTAHIDDLTVSGRKIADFATGSMNAAAGVSGWINVTMTTTGKRVLIFRCTYVRVVVGQGGGESTYDKYASIPQVSITMEQPGEGNHTWSVYQPGGLEPGLTATIAVIELRK
ncbi:TipJ family phage tail tip protein [Azospirillum argentinense]